MAHTSRDKKKLLNRISRIRGQLNGIYKAVDEEQDCGDVMLALASAISEFIAPRQEARASITSPQSRSSSTALWMPLSWPRDRKSVV